MNTNSFKCEKCGEWVDGEEFWLDDLRVCENCYDYEMDKENDLDVREDYLNR